MNFSWSRLRWQGFKRSYLIEVGTISCKECGRIFRVDEEKFEKALAQSGIRLREDLLAMALDSVKNEIEDRTKVY